MDQIEQLLKTTASVGLLLFVLYCFEIDFLPSEVSFGDVGNFLVVIIGTALSFGFYLTLVALTGGLFASLLHWSAKVARPLRRAIEPIGSRLRFNRDSSLVHAFQWIGRFFSLPISLTCTLLGVPSYYLLTLVQDDDIGFRILQVVPYSSSIQKVAFVFSSIAIYAVLCHFISEYYSRITKREGHVFFSPAFILFPGIFSKYPARANFIIVLIAVLSAVFFFPGGYAGFMESNAGAAGIRRDNADILLRNAGAYSKMLSAAETDPCSRVVIVRDGNDAYLSGADLLFHGIGKKSVISLTGLAPPLSDNFEVRSEDVIILHLNQNKSKADSLKAFVFYNYLEDHHFSQLARSFLNLLPDSFRAYVLESKESAQLRKFMARLYPTPIESGRIYARYVSSCLRSLEMLGPWGSETLLEDGMEKRFAGLQAILVPREGMP